jgi:hypothetical protein
VANRYLTRELEPSLRRAAREFPAVIVTGPRQSGKTTLLRHVFPDREIVSLDPPDVREAAARDPRGFLELHPAPVIFDEVQYAPELMPYIRARIDAKRNRAGQYLLTGSQNLLLIERVTETLAGRAAILRLLPLSLSEMKGRLGAPLPWETPHDGAAPVQSPLAHRALWKTLVRGAYPEVALHPRRDARAWHSSYIQTYLERDVRTLRQVGDLTQFQMFVRGLAARSAQLLHLSDLSRDLGIAVNTAKAWLAVLEASDQILVLRPYFANIGKRLVKSPKVYFTDVGTLCALAGFDDPLQAAQGPLGGAIFETAVLMEVVKRLRHRGETARVHFWRTATGTEVDVVVEARRKLIPIEAKLSATPRPAMAADIQIFRRDLGAATAAGFVVHSGDVRSPLGEGVAALPLGAL